MRCASTLGTCSLSTSAVCRSTIPTLTLQRQKTFSSDLGSRATESMPSIRLWTRPRLPLRTRASSLRSSRGGPWSWTWFSSAWARTATPRRCSRGTRSSMRLRARPSLPSSTRRSRRRVA
eukprot:Amastigsp_a858067_4.p4 type:complete len:120 gc:universal Amastigsp_a858067_4:118-477(+)